MRFRKKSLATTPTDTTSEPKPAHTPVVAVGDYSITSYSQEGEDVVLRRFLKVDQPGFYVDIGAHHPERFSNTLFYSSQGWRGINVDADPDLMEDFATARPHDINVTAAVGKGGKSLTFYVFNERAVNTFDKKLANERTKIKGWEIVAERDIPVLPLSEIFEKHLPSKQTIDFMSVDVEGNDFEVLMSNDWKKYRPGFVLVECYDIPDVSLLHKAPIAQYMKKQGYTPVAKTLFTVIFADKL